jgi:predicted ATPase
MDNLAAAISEIVGTKLYETRLRPLLSELKETYHDVRTRPAIGRVLLELIEGQFKGGIPAERLSDGTLRFLAMATIFFHPRPPSLICLEEPELGMHPDAITIVANMIADASERSQIIVTTHSEHLLTALQDRFDVLFAFDTGPAGSLLQRLDREEYKQWRATHALGELWVSGELGGVRY